MASIATDTGPTVATGLLQLRLVERLNLNVAYSSGSTLGSSVRTVSFFGLVRVVSLRLDTTVDGNVRERVRHQTTVAAIVSLSSGAVNQVLLTQGNQFTTSTEMLTFQGASGGKRPARTTHSLVLDGGDVAMLAPVNSGWKCVGVLVLREQKVSAQTMVLAAQGLDLSQTLALEFLVSKITKLVHLDLVGKVALVQSLNFLQVVLEDLTTKLLLVVASVGFAERLLESLPQKFPFSCRLSGTSYREEQANDLHDCSINFSSQLVNRTTRKADLTCHSVRAKNFKQPESFLSSFSFAFCQILDEL